METGACGLGGHMLCRYLHSHRVGGLLTNLEAWHVRAPSHWAMRLVANARVSKVVTPAVPDFWLNRVSLLSNSHRGSEIFILYGPRESWLMMESVSLWVSGDLLLTRMWQYCGSQVPSEVITVLKTVLHQAPSRSSLTSLDIWTTVFPWCLILNSGLGVGDGIESPTWQRIRAGREGRIRSFQARAFSMKFGFFNQLSLDVLSDLNLDAITRDRA